MVGTMKFVIFFVILIMYSIISNFYYLRRSEFLLKVFWSIFEENPKTKYNHMEYQLEVKRIITNAGIEDRYIPTMLPVGYGFVSQTKISILDNCFVINEEISPLVKQMFSQAIGVYKFRLKQSFNPIYWIESIVFLPKTLSKYFGVESNSVIVKIFNILYWIVSFFVFVYDDEIQTFFQSFLSKLIK